VGERDIQKAVCGIKTILCEQDLFVLTMGGGGGKIFVSGLFRDNGKFKKGGMGKTLLRGEKGGSWARLGGGGGKLLVTDVYANNCNFKQIGSG